MNWERIVDVGFAVALVFAFGVSAAAMDSAVTTDPNDVIDLETHLLPIGADQMGELKQEVVEPTDEPPETDDEEQRQSSGESSEQQVEREQAGAGDATVQSSQSDSQAGTTSEIDWLQWLLRQLLLVALLLLCAVGAVVVGVVAGRNRDRLRELLGALLARLGFGDDDTGETLEETTRSEPDCSNEVTRAWYDMVCCLGLDCEQSKTPDECAAAAVEAGHDPAVVRAITEAFQCVRYGDHPVTDDLVAQARAAAERIREQHQHQHQHQQRRYQGQES
jgi:hypothetical protein